MYYFIFRLYTCTPRGVMDPHLNYYLYTFLGVYGKDDIIFRYNNKPIKNIIFTPPIITLSVL